MKGKKNITIAAIALFLLYSPTLNAQVVRFIKNNLQPVNVSMSIEKLKGRQVVKVIKDTGVKAVDQPTFVSIKGVDFKDGTIEVTALGFRYDFEPLSIIPSTIQPEKKRLSFTERVQSEESLLEEMS